MDQRGKKGLGDRRGDVTHPLLHPLGHALDRHLEGLEHVISVVWVVGDGAVVG